MNGRRGIERLASLLGDLAPANPSPSPREIAELIWLSRQLPADAAYGEWPEGATGVMPSSSAPTPPRPLHAHNPVLTPEGAEQAAEDGRLYLPQPTARAEGEDTGSRATPVRVTGAPVLPQRRELTRALRPLKRRIPSLVRAVLDENATADRIAEGRPWMPTFSPAEERWLDAVVVLDAYGDSTTLWEPLGRELASVLRELGAFRNVRLRWLVPDDDGNVTLTCTGASGLARSTATLIDPTGGTVVLVLTDGVDPAWRTPALHHALRGWAQRGPAAILQTLPEHVWEQTALAPESGRFSSTKAGSPGARLRYVPYGLRASEPDSQEIMVPVLGIGPEWLGPWALTVASSGAFDAAAIRLRPPKPSSAPTDSLPDRLVMPDRPVDFEEFRAQAQPQVFRLAACLAAAPLNLAVMRMVQSTMLPGSPPSDLAEILFSGLLRRVPGGRSGDPLERAYDFVPGIRERLLGTMRRDEADEVIATVSAYVERNDPDTAARFTAAIADPNGPLFLPVGARHWAEVHTLVRRRQGRVAWRVPEGESSVEVAEGSGAPPPGGAGRARGGGQPDHRKSEGGPHP
ncbi:SAV_2336 N-terminal domain-related protein, partial [Streptomyces sp. NPDC058572]|uniref:SAV_2336 N-terminal domain-related protein n=1 Tax=Streptomyces sp. NPDC058572 TaxID=3346546 RepID=UPI003657C1F4